MSAGWPHGHRPSANSGPRSGTNPPPVCFNCGQEGHYVVACPQPSRLNTSSFPLPPAQQHPGPNPSPQGYQTYPPNGQYLPPNQPQQYGPPAPYSYSQPLAPQTYGAPSAQYGPGYQPPPYNQYPPQNGPPQYGAPTFQAPPQQYGSPVNVTYPPPPNNFPPPNPAYRGNQGAAPVPHYPTSQWNTDHPTPYGVSSYQRPQRPSSQGFRRETSGTPSQKSYQLTPRQDSISRETQPTQQGPTSKSGNQYPPAQATQNPPNLSNYESTSSSYIPNSSDRHEAIVVAGQDQFKTGTDALDLEKHSKTAGNIENEAPQLENEEHQFNWDFKYIFKEPQKAESVSLAQPLSTTFDMTPVPQVDPKSMRSVSRYARNENLKEFTRNIRAAPQWSYLQEDPAFSEVALEGPLIPVSEIPSWIEKRQGIIQVKGPEATLETSRKRGWSEEQDELDTQLVLETREDIDDDSRAVKRQKNEEAGESNEHMADVEVIDDSLEPPPRGTPVLETPVFGRVGTPCLTDVDDAWAPQPGEGATSPGDPTEALLASLGVTGTPKPVADKPLPLYDGSDVTQQDPRNRESSRSQVLPTSKSSMTSPKPIDGVRTNVPTHSQVSERPNVPYGELEATSQSETQYGSQSASQVLGFRNGHRDGIYNHRSYSNGTTGTPSNNPPPGPPHIISWSNGPPTNVPYVSQPHGSPPQYGPAMNAHYQTGHQTGYQSAPPNTHSNPQWGPPRNASYPNPQYDPPQFDSGPRQVVYYGATSHYGNGSSQISQNDGQSQYNNEIPQNSQYGPIQYANSHSNHAHPQDSYQHINGPQQRYVGPQRAPSYTNSHVPQEHHNNVPQSMPQYALGPQHYKQDENAPPRQDSGYMSAGGSYTNGPEDSEFYPNVRSSQNGGRYIADNERRGNQQTYSEEAGAKGTPEREHMRQRSSTSEEPGTPLSPTSAEILGKLVSTPSSSKKGETSRQVDEGGARKPKRPPPIVAEAYSRRW